MLIFHAKRGNCRALPYFCNSYHDADSIKFLSKMLVGSCFTEEMDKFLLKIPYQWHCKNGSSHHNKHYNLEQNICRLFNILAQFPFTKSEREMVYSHQ